MLSEAARYSLWLTRQLDNQRLDLTKLNEWLTRPLCHDDFVQFADWQQYQTDENEAEFAKQLRLLRRHVMAHIMVRDLNRVSDLAEVTRTITMLADFVVNTALSFSYQYYTGMYGTPIGHYSQAAQFLSVVAMGKAGGFELNVSSDIDLIFVYPENGDTDGKRERSNQAFFTKVGQKLISLINDITEDGQVFRVDMRLRPDGDSGALVCSETALEQYLMTQGREWERYAWCKARIITPYANDIQAIVRPFVFRKYLDFNAYQAMRDLHRQIKQEVQKRSMRHNIKLGEGGIREIEFVAQIFQMIRGGQMRGLQLKGTQETLLKLGELGILAPDIVAKLLKIYVFLRDVEHRLQYWDDQQTQTLPEQAEQQMALAQSMGFDDWDGFSGCLNEYRSFVNQIFNDVLGAENETEDDEHALAHLWTGLPDNGETFECELGNLGFVNIEMLLQKLSQLKQSSKYRQLSSQAQQRFDAIVPRLIQAACSTGQADVTLLRLLDFLDSISRRSSYLAFLQQHTAALQRVADLMAQSAWLADYLRLHPILLDELLSDQLMQAIDWQNFSAELSGSLKACGDDTEAKMDVLRQAQHAQIFRLTVQDLAGQWTVEALSDELSILADVILEQTLIHTWQSVPKHHLPAPKFAIIAYGKLGGKELGYASDLDLVYLYDDDFAEASDLYTKLSRRLSTWLSGSTGAGTLYELDLRLRPNGEAGFLAHSVAAFDKYQREQAWTWEHQSLTRARFVCGDAEIGAKFEQIRRDILTQERDKIKLKQDIIAMREKMFATHPPLDNHVKYARGGLVDVEFLVQYLVLAESRNEPKLLENYGNIALLGMAARRGLIDADLADKSAAAYRYYRQIQHNKNLRDSKRVEVNDELLSHYEVVRQLWLNVFGEAVRFQAALS